VTDYAVLIIAPTLLSQRDILVDNGPARDSISLRVLRSTMPSRLPLFSMFLLLFASVLSDAQTATCTNWAFFNQRIANSFHGAHGINRWGTVVGNTSYVGKVPYPAFVRYSNGSLKTYLAPNASSTVFTGRNAQGVTVGYYTDNTSSSHTHGLVVSGSSMVTVNYPGAADTFLQGINYWGTIVGAYFSPGSFMEKAFVLKNGVFTPIVPFGSTWNSAMGISDKGVIVGWYYDSSQLSKFRGFTLANGVYTTVDHPKGTPGGTQLYDINSSGVIVGRYNVDFGFIYSNGIFKDVNVPNNQFSNVEGINGYGDVTGIAYGSGNSALFTARCQ
jgi:uncharacterized membrane protein